MRFLKRIFKKSVHVKPETPNDPRTRWLVVQGNTLQHFWDDLMYVGLETAWINFKMTILNQIPESPKTPPTA